MATHVLGNVGDRFPSGTTVTAWPAAARRDGAAPAPASAQVDSATAAASSVTFTSVVQHVRYVAYALVNGVNVYVGFIAAQDSGIPSTTKWADIVAARRAARGTA